MLAVLVLAALRSGVVCAADDGIVLFQQAIRAAGKEPIVTGGVAGKQYYQDAFAPSKLFDGTTDTHWYGQVVMKNGTGNTFVVIAAPDGTFASTKVVLKRYRMFQQVVGTIDYANMRRPTAWTLEGSNDQTNRTPIQKIGGDGELSAGWHGNYALRAAIPAQP